jgi:hypothetical protein
MFSAKVGRSTVELRDQQHGNDGLGGSLVF